MSTCSADMDMEAHPFKSSSERCLTLLIRLSLDRDEVHQLLLTPQYGQRDGETSISHVYSRLARHIQTDEYTARRVDQKFGQLFAGLECNQGECSVYELAYAWSQMREQLDAPSAAALLWAVARARPHCYRKLEAAIVEDLDHTAVRCLSVLGEDYPSWSDKLSSHRVS